MRVNKCPACRQPERNRGLCADCRALCLDAGLRTRKLREPVRPWWWPAWLAEMRARARRGEALQVPDSEVSPGTGWGDGHA